MKLLLLLFLILFIIKIKSYDFGCDNEYPHYCSLDDYCYVCLCDEETECFFYYYDCNCYSCVAGAYYSEKDNDCYSCPTGTYSNIEGIPTSCTECEPGTYSSTVRPTSCTSCPTGSYSLSGASSCTKCPTGKYQDKTS